MNPNEPWDVVVVGGGTAGIAAAIAAARQGAKTVVVERLGSFGGTQANGWVTPMMPNYIGDFKLSRGVNLDIIGAQESIQPAGELEHADEWYDPTMLSKVLDDLANEAGVTPLFDTSVVQADVSNGSIRGITVISRGRPFSLVGRCYVDASGDAELGILTGAEIMSGNSQGVHQPMTLRFTMAGIDLGVAAEDLAPHLRIRSNGYLEAGFGEAKDGSMGHLVEEAIRRGTLYADDLGYFQFFTMNGRPGELAFNCPRLTGFDPLDPFEMSRAYQIGRQKIMRIAKFMRESFAGFAGSYVSTIAPLMGIRESRRIVGDYILTEEDHQDCRKFDDVVARNRYPVDIHLEKGIDYRKFPPGEWHDIPYGAIVVRGFDNFWVAGRCASATFVAQSAIRIQPVCRALGEAAGVAASLCAQNNWSSRSLPYEELRGRLDLATP